MDTVKNVKSRQVNVSIDDEISCQDQEDNSRLDRSDRSAVAESEHDHHPGKLISSDFSVTSRKMDPYKELELYLAKVIEEIDNIIVPSLPGESVEASGESKLTSKKFETKCPPDKSIVTNQLSPTNKTLSVYVKSLNARSKVNVVETPVIQYRDLLSEFGISDDDSVDEESKNFSKVEANNNWNLKDEISLPVNNDNIDNNNKQGCLNSDYDEPKDMIPTCLRLNRKSGSEPGIPDGRMIRKENQTIRFNYDEINDGIWDDEKCNSSSLPANLEFVKIQETSRCCEIVQVKPKKILDISFKSLRRRGSTNENEGNSPKMPPKHSESRHRKNTVTPVSLIKCKLPTGTLQRAFKVPEKHSQDHNNVLIESDDNLMLKFKSPNENFHKSVPVSSSEDKSLPPFSKILRKKHSFVNKNNVNDAILVRVSSLPDQDLLDISKDRLNGKTHNFSDNLFSKKKRAISPFTLRSDIIAKRLSESDKDINQISPVKLNAVFFPVMKDDEVNSQNDRNISDISTESDRSEDVKGDYIGAFDCVDTDSRTSPVISRSSNSLWVNDCESLREVSQLDSESLHDEVTLDPASPHDTVDEDNRSSSSSQDLVQSMDEISSGSISPDTIDRASPLESGIGTASPPRSTDRQSAKPSISNKHHRKETWEKLRKRSFKSNNTRSVKGSTDVWVRRESIHVQTPRCDNGGSQEAVDSSSGIDDTLPRKKSPRPSHLPLGLAMTGSSSLSSAEMLESQIPSSPSTASLQLNYEPLTMELSEKSNSAPFLENNNVEKTTEINETVQLPCSQSNNRLSEIEAQEACKWLRAAGFPQYAQMYE
ncbi:uncharacterized protein, partial [Chelonus insularis]|uniref:uncharacterized protein n=1 Tax=Chelonus insularis TaxID=460826 RepID=UPI00158F1F68